MNPCALSTTVWSTAGACPPKPIDLTEMVKQCEQEGEVGAVHAELIT